MMICQHGHTVNGYGNENTALKRNNRRLILQQRMNKHRQLFLLHNIPFIAMLFSFIFVHFVLDINVKNAI